MVDVGAKQASAIGPLWHLARPFVVGVYVFSHPKPPNFPDSHPYSCHRPNTDPIVDLRPIVGPVCMAAPFLANTITPNRLTYIKISNLSHVVRIHGVFFCVFFFFLFLFWPGVRFDILAWTRQSVKQHRALIKRAERKKEYEIIFRPISNALFSPLCYVSRVARRRMEGI